MLEGTLVAATAKALHLAAAVSARETGAEETGHFPADETSKLTPGHRIALNTCLLHAMTEQQARPIDNNLVCFGI